MTKAKALKDIKKVTAKNSPKNIVLEEIAMLVHVRINCYKGRKNDKKVAEENNQKYNAVDAFTVNKKIFNDPRFQKMVQICGAARFWVHSVTRPWLDRGTRILPSKLYLDFAKTCREYVSSLDEAKAIVKSMYKEIVDSEQARMGEAFKSEEYPPVETLLSKYSITPRFFPIPVADDFRVNIKQADLDRIKEETENAKFEILEEGMKELWERLFKVVNHMVERLSDPNAVLYESVVTNIAEQCEILPYLNITEDPNLDKMLRDVTSKLTSLDITKLRTDKKERKTAATQAKSILDQMKGYTG